uniref:Uncharacterized protein n=1 Tax=Chromera velia CCMP2878 TaxID=1169474 RepID=A0A0G4GEU3_9ALVE|eukprot:Cvel_4583.t1-p1 / transcript=Cvel_4583.t1 / gene=Cvel_4583 / organism=Chromera_velia_CCMP2878 / gene_product=hypothetical protein / transcript_product=hypothetical protein / location=Cvel_scaffold201:74972-76549(+) / protein_length=268 / sequence_SO=supercontig / SO=protein_coding / is_pseudo=false
MSDDITLNLVVHLPGDEKTVKLAMPGFKGGLSLKANVDANRAQFDAVLPKDLVDYSEVTGRVVHGGRNRIIPEDQKLVDSGILDGDVVHLFLNTFFSHDDYKRLQEHKKLVAQHLSGGNFEVNEGKLLADENVEDWDDHEMATAAAAGRGQLRYDDDDAGEYDEEEMDGEDGEGEGGGGPVFLDIEAFRRGEQPGHLAAPPSQARQLEGEVDADEHQPEGEGRSTFDLREIGAPVPGAASSSSASASASHPPPPHEEEDDDEEVVVGS